MRSCHGVWNRRGRGRGVDPLSGIQIGSLIYLPGRPNVDAIFSRFTSLYSHYNYER